MLDVTLGPRKRSGIGRKLLAILALGLAVAGAVFYRVDRKTGETPKISIRAHRPAVGPSTRVTVVVEAGGRGLSPFVVELVQGDRVVRLAERSHTPTPPWTTGGTTRDEVEVEVGRRHQPELLPKPLAIRVTAEIAPTWTRRPEPEVASLELPVRLVPPTVAIKSAQVYVRQGGSEVVVYEVSETAVESGVRIGSWWFPGHRLPGAPAADRTRFALFGFPYDLDDPDRAQVVARDDVGNEMAVHFIAQFRRDPMREASIEITDKFLTRVLPPLLAQTPELTPGATPLDTFLAINSKLRRANADRLVELAARSREEFLFRRPFAAMPAKVMSSFADRRSYVYQGKKIDEQIHLGFDLASTAAAPVPAVNGGEVVLASYFGIYGNTVVLDHGFGLLSLYSHLSSVAVAPGQRVEAGTILGQTGATGLAGGDHLHFTMLVGGLPVNPIEWWDAHWLEDRIKLKLGDALPLGG